MQLDLQKAEHSTSTTFDLRTRPTALSTLQTLNRSQQWTCYNPTSLKQKVCCPNGFYLYVLFSALSLVISTVRLFVAQANNSHRSP
jgi:hypothetical protein